ncbi:MAG TPA: Ig-like domain-containing protein [Roseiflexaceae bacterium]|nr:Ig-like domain-containing protein [Roseiflexaceae bacterium]
MPVPPGALLKAYPAGVGATTAQPARQQRRPDPTLLPKPGSPTLDAAGGSPCATATDQRGVSRPQGEACDIGAVEVFPNSAPVATDDTYSTAEDTPVSGNVLTNDTDADNDALTAIKLTDPSHGVLSFNADGTFTYTPAANYNGVDGFSYKANDGQADSDEATVTITVTAINDAPSMSVTTGQCLSDSKARGSLSLVLGDVDNDSLSLSATSSNAKLLPSKGIVLGGSGANRNVSISAADKQSGTAVVAVKVSDGTDTTTLNLTVKVGTPQDETLSGTNGVDMLFGMNGRNTLDGLGGNDLLCGGNADDTLNGGDGNDALSGGRGNDALGGGGGDDTLTGGQGADNFSGGAGADTATDLTPSQGDTQDGTLP